MYFLISAAWKACILIWENAVVAPLCCWTASAGARFVLLFEFFFDCTWQSRQVGMTSLAKSPVAAIRMALDGLEFIHSHLGVGKGNNEKFLQVKAYYQMLLTLYHSLLCFIKLTLWIQPGPFKDAVVELKQQLQVRCNAAETAARLQAQEDAPLLPWVTIIIILICHELSSHAPCSCNFSDSDTTKDAMFPSKRWEICFAKEYLALDAYARWCHHTPSWSRKNLEIQSPAVVSS
jgi:hypothetical protein